MMYRPQHLELAYGVCYTVAFFKELEWENVDKH